MDLNLQGVRILVTGAGGFLGSHLSEFLYQQGAVVYPIRRDNYDLRNESEVLMAALVSRPEVIIHLASPARTLSPAVRFREALQMGMNVVHAAAGADARLIWVAPDRVYPPGELPASEEHFFHDALGDTFTDTEACISKMIAALVETYRQSCGLRGLGLIFPQVYGPGDRSSGVQAIAHALHARKGEKSVGLPMMAHWLLHVSDAALALGRVAVKHDLTGILNIPGTLALAKDLVKPLYAGFGMADQKIKIEWFEPAKPLQRELCGKKAEELLEWKPSADGMKAALTTYAALLDHELGRRALPIEPLAPQASLPGKDTP